MCSICIYNISAWALHQNLLKIAVHSFRQLVLAPWLESGPRVLSMGHAPCCEHENNNNANNNNNNNSIRCGSQQTSNMEICGELPLDIWENILAFLPLREKLNFGLTCRSWELVIKKCLRSVKIDASTPFAGSWREYQKAVVQFSRFMYKPEEPQLSQYFKLRYTGTDRRQHVGGQANGQSRVRTLLRNAISRSSAILRRRQAGWREEPVEDVPDAVFKEAEGNAHDEMAKFVDLVVHFSESIEELDVEYYPFFPLSGWENLLSSIKGLKKLKITCRTCSTYTIPYTFSMPFLQQIMKAITLNQGHIESLDIRIPNNVLPLSNFSQPKKVPDLEFPQMRSVVIPNISNLLDKLFSDKQNFNKRSVLAKLCANQQVEIFCCYGSVVSTMLTPTYINNFFPKMKKLGTSLTTRESHNSTSCPDLSHIDLQHWLKPQQALHDITSNHGTQITSLCFDLTDYDDSAKLVALHCKNLKSVMVKASYSYGEPFGYMYYNHSLTPKITESLSYLSTLTKLTEFHLKLYQLDKLWESEEKERIVNAIINFIECCGRKLYSLSIKVHSLTPESPIPNATDIFRAIGERCERIEMLSLKISCKPTDAFDAFTDAQVTMLQICPELKSLALWVACFERIVDVLVNKHKGIKYIDFGTALERKLFRRGAGLINRNEELTRGAARVLLDKLPYCVIGDISRQYKGNIF